VDALRRGQDRSGADRPRLGAPTLNIWAIVPVKSLVDAKSRLAARLDATQREELSRDLFLGTLRRLREVERLAATLVVSPDPAVLALAELEHVRVLEESPPGDLNRALTQAAAVAQERGAGAIVIVPIDLPLARPDDIRSAVELVAAVGAHRVVAAAPDRHGVGTNLLALRPPDAIPFEFGPHSLRRHRAAAEARGIVFHAIDNPRLASDLDEPSDLALVGLA
jgi:2-phospho-L-lactate guanylyltransferase